MTEETRDAPVWELWRLLLWSAALAVQTRMEAFYRRKGGRNSALVCRRRFKELVRGGPRAL